MNTAKSPQINETEKRIALSFEDGASVSQLVDRVRAKKWVAVTIVEGSPEIRRTFWLEANLAGLEVRGYQPSISDKALLRQLKGERQREDEIHLRADQVVNHYDQKVLPKLNHSCERLQRLRERYGLRSTELEHAYRLNQPSKGSMRELDRKYFYSKQVLSNAREMRELFSRLGNTKIPLTQSFEDGLTRYVPADKLRARNLADELELTRGSERKRTYDGKL